MQRGRASSGFDGGVFSPVMDVATLEFHSWIARAMLYGRYPKPGAAR
jgi:choline monooxygenase